MTIDLIYQLNLQGMRVFSTSDVYDLSISLGISRNYVTNLLSNLAQKRAIHHIVKGKYALDNNLLSGQPLHEFEIASSLSNNGAIAYISALAFHNLTDQIPSAVYSMSFSLVGNSNTHVKHYVALGGKYIIIKTSSKNHWGIETAFIDEIPFYITNLERTLLDGLERPEYFMGIREVLSAFTIAINRDKIDVEKICKYALDHGTISLSKRLGFILTKIMQEKGEPAIDAVKELQKIPSRVYQKLDILGHRKGKYHKEWMIIENI
ncbi:MAG: hypothetical protein SFT68_05930 [Rickettsiaceae bacterium]|nr:hypothetical protein [Rickettsiaceae bacterium]